MAMEVFNRYEKKFLLNRQQYEKVMESLQDRMELDTYNKDGKAYTITNLYLDTKDDYLIRRSLDKPEYKEKIRLRSYGRVTEEDPVFLEIKKKNLDMGNKRRTVMTLKDAKAYLLQGKVPWGKTSNQQILKEIEYLRTRMEIVPKVFLAYDRIAYFEKERRKEGLRITFDWNIRSRRTNLSLEADAYGVPMLEPETCLMEIKVIDSIPLWLSHILAEEKIYSLSFSKYGREYQEYCNHKNLILKNKGEVMSNAYIYFGNSRNRECFNN